MKCIALFLMGVSLAGAQVFHSDDEFYQYLENRQSMAIAEAQAQAWALERAAQERAQAKEREHEKVMEAVTEELDLQTMRDIEWLRRYGR